MGGARTRRGAGRPVGWGAWRQGTVPGAARPPWHVGWRGPPRCASAVQGPRGAPPRRGCALRPRGWWWVPDVAEEGSTIPTFTTWKATGTLAAAWGVGPGSHVPAGATAVERGPSSSCPWAEPRAGQHGPAVGSGAVRPGALPHGGAGEAVAAHSWHPALPGAHGCRALAGHELQPELRTQRPLWEPLGPARACPQPTRSL